MNKQKILISGIAGFCGSHLSEYILENHDEYEIHGTVRYRTDRDNIKHIENKLILHPVDITDSHGLDDLIKEIKPDKIFHLAANTFVPESWINPIAVMNVNAGGTVNILEAMRKYSPETIISVNLSSEQYGKVYENEIPIKETNQFRPQSPYAVSKISAEYYCYQYNQSYGLKVIRNRCFNFSGARRGEQFATSNFVKQAVEIKKGLKDYIYVGNLEAKRDFSSVKEIVRALWLTTELNIAYGDVFNICSGVCWSIKNVLDIILKLLDLDYDKIVKIDDSRLRVSDVPILLGDNTKIRQTTGWKPQYNIYDIIDDLIEYWYEKLS